MKMKSLQTGLLVSALLVAGCGGGEDSTVNGKSVMYTGELKNLGEVLVDGQADYILDTGEGTVYYVYSDFLDLGKEKYKDVKVQISGKVTKVTESGKEIIAVESIVPLTKEVMENDAMQDTVKKYQSLKMGFRIDGLIDFSVQEFENQVNFEKGGSSFSVTRFDNPNSLSLDEWLKLSNVSEVTPLFIGHDKLKAYMYKESQYGNSYYVSRTNRYIYQIETRLAVSDDALRSELATILDSFRFVPLSETASGGETGNRSAVEMEKVKSYFSEHLSEFVPDYGGNKYSVIRYEFLNVLPEDMEKDSPNYLYIGYGADDESVGRILVSYDFTMNKVSNAVTEAVFKEGGVTDWKLVDGEDKVAGLPTIVVKADGDKAPIALMEGFRLFESTPFKFSVQYPSNWYVEGRSGKYLFNDAPLKDEYLVSIEVQKKKIEDVVSDIPFSFERSDSIPGREVFIARPKEGEKYGMYMVMSRKDGEEVYVLWSISSNEELLKKMAGTIMEN